MSANRLWTFLSGLLATGENGNVGIPQQRPSDDEVKEIARKALSSNKGADWAARLFEDCAVDELPVTVLGFLTQVYGCFPKPAESPNDRQTADAVPEAGAAAPPAGVNEAVDPYPLA
jgi:putative ATP-dependent endonuclease of OLD family